METNRRAVLAALAAGSAALAGCTTGDSGDDDPDGPVNNTPDEGEEPSGTDGGRSGENDEADGEVPALRSELPEGFPEECPTYDNVVSAICYDAVNPEELPAVLEPSTQTVGEGEPIDFVLSNRSEETIEFNPHNWLVHKHVDGEWVRIPRSWVLPLFLLEPGDSQTWSFVVDNSAVENGEAVSRSLGALNGDGSNTPRTLEGLGGGQYAFRARGNFANESHEESVAFATTFGVDTDPLPLTTTDAITDTGWDGETLVAHSERVDPERDRARLGAFELERLDDGGDAERRITEQLIRNDPRRDAVALAEQHDADRVRIEEYNTTSPIFGSRSDGVFEYQGTHYEVSTRELDEG